MSTTQRSGPASIRFWASGRNNLGAILALLAGLINIAVVVWPLVNAVGRGDLNPGWRWIGALVGLGYLAAFFLADTRWKLARTVLLAGAAIQILAALTLGRAYEAQSGMFGQLIGLFDFVPAILAVVAAFLIGRAPSRAEIERSESRR